MSKRQFGDEFNSKGDLMTPARRSRWLPVLACASLAAVALSACQTRPTIRTQSAPALDIVKYRSFGFVEHPDTDKAGYTPLTTRYLKDAVSREMLARGYS